MCWGKEDSKKKDLFFSPIKIFFYPIKILVGGGQSRSFFNLRHCPRWWRLTHFCFFFPILRLQKSHRLWNIFSLIPPTLCIWKQMVFIFLSQERIKCENKERGPMSRPLEQPRWPRAWTSGVHAWKSVKPLKYGTAKYKEFTFIKRNLNQVCTSGL